MKNGGDDVMYDDLDELDDDGLVDDDDEYNEITEAPPAVNPPPRTAVVSTSSLQVRG